MSSYPIRSLTSSDIAQPYQPRQFVPQNADLRNLPTVEVLYQALLERPLDNLEALNRFLDDRCELDAALDQQQSLLYIGMTSQTDNTENANSYRTFISTIEPAVRPLEDQLNRKTLEALTRFPPDHDYFQVYLRNLKADAELFSEENIPLLKQEALLKQEYQSIQGAMTVTFNEQEYTMAQMATFLQDPDRALRQNAWQAQAERRLKEGDTLETLFDRLRSLRIDIARNLGFHNYREYKFKEYHRFDYTADDCKQFHKAIQKFAVPLYRDILIRRRSKMKQDSLRPWDLDTNPSGKPALKPFESADQLIRGTGAIFQRMDEELASYFDLMTREGLLDLESRPGKAPGGYQCSLTEARKPFIFMNAVGTDRDLIVLLHESGHAFHALACRDQRLLPYRHAPMEFCEVASMTMELLGRKYLNEFYTPEDLKRYYRKQLEQIVQILCWIATVDAFQHWLYEDENATSDQRTEAWMTLHRNYISHEVDWSGLEHVQRELWHQQLHIFLYPFYYIEYGIAQLGALGIWKQSLDNELATLSCFKNALALGSSVPLPQLFETAGINFDFSATAIEPALNIIRKELEL